MDDQAKRLDVYWSKSHKFFLWKTQIKPLYILSRGVLINPDPFVFARDL